MRRISIVVSVILLASAPTVHAQDLTINNFDSIRSLVLPTPAESGWSSIPWMNDLFVARQRAAQTGKPLFVWSMAAEPLGIC